MAKLRHLAIIVQDAEKAAVFFEQAFGMKRVIKNRRGYHMTDGIVSVALLAKEKPEERIGLYHFGMWVDDFDSAEAQAMKAGASYLGGRPTSPTAFYEFKYQTPEGIVFDLTHTGWPGAVKDPTAKG